MYAKQNFFAVLFELNIRLNKVIYPAYLYKFV